MRGRSTAFRRGPPIVERRVEHDGCTLVFDVAGAGPPVLFIQGVGVAGTGWQPQTRALSDRFTCISFDHRGLGRSQPTVAAVRVEQMAEDALAVMDAAAWPSAHVVGHSLGGPIALEIALRARSRVRSLGLLCTFSGARTAAPLSLRLLWLGLKSRVGTRRSRRRGFLGLVLAPGTVTGVQLDAWSERLGELFGHDVAEQPPVAAQQLRALRAYDASSRLAELAGLPALVVSARHDPIAPPRAGRALAEMLPGAGYREIADASHGLPITHAELVNELLVEHFGHATT